MSTTIDGLARNRSSEGPGVAIFTCEPCGFVQLVPDPPKSRPNCSKCGKPAQHSGPDAYKRIVDAGGGT
jgi:hypothetical protein